jgi:L-fuconolactonase
MNGIERICDAHHHLWDLPTSTYRVADLHADLATVPEVTRTVFVECGAWYRDDGPEHLRSVGETEWVAANADPAVTQAIVGATDLRLGARTEEALHAHVEAGQGRFRGIRQMATWDPSPLIRPTHPDPGPGLLTDGAFRAGFAALHRLGHSFDAWIYFPQLPEVASLARAFPDTTIVLDHYGGVIGLGPYAGRRDDVLARWRELLPEVAACPNVVMKLGGIGMPIYGLDWHKRPEPPGLDAIVGAWQGPTDVCIELFGVERCLFESNFPVDRFSLPYATVWNAFDAMTRGLSPVERAALFHDNAVRVYQLPA